MRTIKNYHKFMIALFQHIIAPKLQGIMAMATNTVISCYITARHEKGSQVKLVIVVS